LLRQGVGILKFLWRKPVMLNVGDPAPDFTVQDHTGKTRSLSDYSGRNVVLWFYPKADTPG
jgi:thioredoxin-dependent peroxiredoxin